MRRCHVREKPGGKFILVYTAQRNNSEAAATLFFPFLPSRCRLALRASSDGNGGVDRAESATELKEKREIGFFFRSSTRYVSNDSDALSDCNCASHLTQEIDACRSCHEFLTRKKKEKRKKIAKVINTTNELK